MVKNLLQEPVTQAPLILERRCRLKVQRDMSPICVMDRTEHERNLLMFEKLGSKATFLLSSGTGRLLTRMAQALQTANRATLLGFSGYHWLVIAAGWAGWGFDVFDALL